MQPDCHQILYYGAGFERYCDDEIFCNFLSVERMFACLITCLLVFVGNILYIMNGL